jgi:hypothetical protein
MRLFALIAAVLAAPASAQTAPDSLGRSIVGWPVCAESICAPPALAVVPSDTLATPTLRYLDALDAARVDPDIVIFPCYEEQPLIVQIVPPAGVDPGMIRPHPETSARPHSAETPVTPRLLAPERRLGER